MSAQTFKLKINQDQILYIDESGNLGRGDRYFVITVVRFKTKADYRKWQDVVKDFLDTYPFLTKNTKHKREMKGYKMPYRVRKMLLLALQNINVDVYYGVIDTNHPHYKSNFIQKGYVSKEIPFNYTLNKLFQKHIAQHINATKMVINMDERTVRTGQKHDLECYINVATIDNTNHQCNEVIVRYHDSARVHGIQLADFIGSTIYRFYELSRNKNLYHKYISSKIKGKVMYPDFY